MVSERRRKRQSKNEYWRERGEGSSQSTSSALSWEQVSFQLSAKDCWGTAFCQNLRESIPEPTSRVWEGSEAKLFLRAPHVHTWNGQSWLWRRTEGSCWFMARNELLEELWRLAIVATVFQVQRLVIDTLLHRQPVKSSQDRFDMLRHFLCVCGPLFLLRCSEQAGDGIELWYPIDCDTQ